MSKKFHNYNCPTCGDRRVVINGKRVCLYCRERSEMRKAGYIFFDTDQRRRRTKGHSEPF